MGLFGQYANVYDSVQNTIYDRTVTRNTELVSGLKPWIRISSAVHNGLILGTGISLDDSFDNLYGNDKRAGKIGNSFSGAPVFETSTAFARGYRPSPIIEAIGIENGSEGLTRKLSFEVKCFSLPQLDIITQYFLEPRFYLLAEWGWNTTDAYAHMAKIENTTVNKAVCEMIQYMNLGTLKDKRYDSKGNYDAFLGVITGGNVDFADDETYIVRVEVMTQGEIPAYLQQHKGTVESITSDGSAAKSSLAYTISDIENTQKNAETLGPALFMYMFNDLPPQKQIASVKSLINQTTKQVSESGIKVDAEFLEKNPDSLYWCQEWQYINMNTTYRDILREKLIEGAQIDIGGVTRTYNGEQPLISECRFIRMELAWRILNEVGKNDVIREPYSCEGNSVSVPNFTISIDDTIIRAHKHMFSTNREFLFIPNAVCPDFGLKSLLSDPSADTTQSSFVVVTGGVLNTKNVMMNKTPKTYQFPRGISLEEAGIELAEQYDDSYQEIDKAPNTWGYLKDLYINFDFFVECLNRNGALIKDVAVDILNGLSQACNMFWDFQIVEIGSTNSKDKGVQKLVIVDANFAGLPRGGKVVTGGNSGQNLFRLQTIGSNSPVLEINMKLEVQGAIANQVMMQRGDLLNNGSDVGKSSATVEDKVEDFSGLFSTGMVDNLTTKIIEIQKATGLDSGVPESGSPGSVDSDVELSMGLDSAGNEVLLFKGVEYRHIPQRTATVGTTTVIYPAETARQQVDAKKAELAAGRTRDIIQSNWVTFIQKAAVLSRLNDPSRSNFTDSGLFNFSGADADFDSLVVGIWEDSQLLRQIYEYDMIDPNDATNRKFEARTNPGYLPIEVEFAVHGVSGFKVGDMIHFADLPHVYRQKIFTVMNVTQTIDGDIWKTIVTTACRNLNVDGSNLPLPAPPPAPLPGQPGSIEDREGNRQGQQTPLPAPSPGNRDPREPENYEPGSYWPPGQEPWNQ